MKLFMAIDQQMLSLAVISPQHKEKIALQRVSGASHKMSFQLPQEHFAQRAMLVLRSGKTE